MGWANCGTDSNGRPIGHVHAATCDEPGCEARIDRGLAYACGGMHGEDVDSCEGYFCDAHLTYPDVEDDHQPPHRVCRACARMIEEAVAEEAAAQFGDRVSITLETREERNDG